jgi:hypothetical protein
MRIMFLRACSLANGLRHLFCFPHSIPDVSVLVANNHESAETQIFPTFHHLGYSINGNNLVLQFLRIRIDLFQASSNKPVANRRPGERTARRLTAAD